MAVVWMEEITGRDGDRDKIANKTAIRARSRVCSPMTPTTLTAHRLCVITSDCPTMAIPGLSAGE